MDLSPTALYTAGVWAWARLPGAELLDHADSRWTFGAVNLALAAARPFQREPVHLPGALVGRHLAFDRILAESGCRRVLELAAGLSARGLRASADPSVAYVELDRPGVMERKRALLARSAAGRQALARPNLRLGAADLDHADLPALLPPGDGPLLVIAEGLFMYLPAVTQRRLWRRLHDLAPARFVFDLVPAVEQPPPGLAGRALASLMRRFTGGGDFVRDERTRADLAAELRAAGFARVELVEPGGRQLIFVCVGA